MPSSRRSNLCLASLRARAQVFLHAEKQILGAFQEALAALWEPSRNTYAVNDAVQVGSAKCWAGVR